MLDVPGLRISTRATAMPTRFFGVFGMSAADRGRHKAENSGFGF
jgi:hypothetical protein